MNLLVSLAASVLAYFVAHLVFNEPISFLIAVLVFLSVFFGGKRWGATHL